MVDQEAEDQDALAARLRRTGAAMARLQGDVEAGGPWPLSDRFGVDAESHWGPPETLAHVAEMVPFWTGEMERVLAGGSEPVPFGRIASDPLRIRIIERDRTLPARELFARIAADVDRLARRVTELSTDDARRRGLHPTLGEMTVALLVERFVIGHLEEHVDQLQATLRTD